MNPVTHPKKKLRDCGMWGIRTQRSSGIILREEDTRQLGVTLRQFLLFLL